MTGKRTDEAPPPKRRRAPRRGPTTAEQLAEIASGIAALRALSEEAASHRLEVLESIQKLEETLWKGTPETPSVIVRLSLLEQAQKERVLAALLVLCKAAARQRKVVMLILVGLLMLLAKLTGVDVASFKKLLELALSAPTG